MKGLQTMLQMVRDEEGLLAYCNRHGLAIRLLGRTLYGRGIFAIDVSGPSDRPPIIITAGSHATEPAGIFAALTLARNLRIGQRIIIVPIRDPLGWEGYEAYLSLALGKRVQFGSHTELEAILESQGDLVWQDETLTIAQVNTVFFLSMPTQPAGRGPMDIWKRLHCLLREEPSLVQQLQGHRLILPENLPNVDGCGIYDHAFTAWVTSEGGVGNLNRLFSMDHPPIEVEVIAQLVRELHPELVIDLHESQGSKFSIFAHPDLTPGATEVYFGATGAVFAAGHAVERLSDLVNTIGADHAAKFEDQGGGVITGLNEFPGQGWQFTHLCAELGAVTVTTETGRWQPLASRIKQHVLATRGAVFAYLHNKVPC